MNPFDQVVAVFRSEVSELLDSLGQLVEGLPALAPEARGESLQAGMRITHSIKGISATAGFMGVQRLAHAAETVLQSLQSSAGAPIEAVAAILLDAVTAMQQMSDGRADDEEDGALLERLLGAAGGSTDTQPVRRSFAPSARPAPSSSTPAGRASVRVETSRLDKLMDHTGELLVTHAQQAARAAALAQLREDLAHAIENLDAGGRAALAPVSLRLDQMLQQERRERDAFGRLARELGSAMKQVRMLPLEGLAASWRQLVRETAQQLGRRAELVVEAAEIELDKYVLDRIRDPLIHLLRNAIAHGIESPEERLAKGKPEVGKVRVRATAQGAQVKVDVSDDGRGLDPKLIGEVARQKRIVSPEQLDAMSPSQLLQLIFADGFSTAKQVGNVSGRGVGLSVVRSNVKALGGRIEVGQLPGEVGACFTLRLPVSAISRRGLLVRAGRGIWALPIESVERTVRAARSRLEHADGQTVVRGPAGEPVWVRTLAELMGQTEARGSDDLRVVILSHGEARLGVVVDEVLHEDDYVVKRLPANLRAVAGVDGAIILADGGLAIAVNVPELFEQATRSREQSLEVAGVGAPKRRQRVLVVDDMLTVRAYHRSVLEAAGCEVVMAADGMEAWEMLQRTAVDVVVSDVMMPRMDGFALTARLRAEGRLRDLPVVLVSSRGSAEDVAAGAAAGANEYLVKERFESEKLVSAVRRFRTR